VELPVYVFLRMRADIAFSVSSFNAEAVLLYTATYVTVGLHTYFFMIGSVLIFSCPFITWRRVIGWLRMVNWKG